MLYRIDRDDELVYVDDEWERFAAENAGGQLRAEAVLHRRLWDFITDEHTREIYHQIVQRARAGREVQFEFRCDSPTEKRLMRMSVAPRPEQAVEFRTHVLFTAPIAVPAGADEEPDPRVAFVRQCAWCKRIWVNGEWLDFEQALAALRIFGRKPPPPITHGMCEACLARMEQIVD